MNVEIINPFVESALSVFQTMLDSDAKRVGLELSSAEEPPYDVTGIIGLSGKANGDVIVSFHQDVVFGAAEAMIGEKLTELDSTAIDVTGELTNIIAGRAKAGLAHLEMSLSLPTVVMGKEHKICFGSNVQPISIPFDTSLGPFNITVGLAFEPSAVAAAMAAAGK